MEYTIPKLSGNESQWEEAIKRIQILKNIHKNNDKRLLEILRMNQNPNCGGDGSINEKNWYQLRTWLEELGLVSRIVVKHNIENVVF